MDDVLSVWLVPDEEDKKYLGQIIEDLGIRYNAPLFTPHLTLFGDLTIDLENLKAVVNEVFKNVKTFGIKKTRVNQSEKFFKTVFIEFEIDENLTNLFTAISRKTDNRDIYTFKPHLSLIYKIMTEKEKINIIKGLKIKDEFTIGSVYVNAPKKGSNDFMDVKGWRVLYEKELNH